MPFIKLTKIDKDLAEQDFKLVDTFTPFYTIISNIAHIEIKKEGTRVYFLAGELLYIIVKETPEEILRMIKEEYHLDIIGPWED